MIGVLDAVLAELSHGEGDAAERAILRVSSAGRYFALQTCAQPMKNRWSPLRPSRVGASALPSAIL